MVSESSFPLYIVDNTEKSLHYHRGDSVVVFQYYQQFYMVYLLLCGM